MDTDKIKELLTLASETHHAVWLKQDGNDPDWPIWYSDWLVDHSDFPEIVSTSMTKSQLVHFFVQADKDFSADHPTQDGWADYYAEHLDG